MRGAGTYSEDFQRLAAAGPLLQNDRKEISHSIFTSTIYTNVDCNDACLSLNSINESKNVMSTIPQRQKRTNIRRVRTGCLTCRERRIKCDELIPSCRQCLRSGRVCKKGMRVRFRPLERSSEFHGSGGSVRTQVTFLLSTCRKRDVFYDLII